MAAKHLFALAGFIITGKLLVAIGKFAVDLIRRVPRRLFDITLLLILPARRPGNKVAYQLDH